MWSRHWGVLAGLSAFMGLHARRVELGLPLGNGARFSADCIGNQLEHSLNAGGSGDPADHCPTQVQVFEGPPDGGDSSRNVEGALVGDALQHGPTFFGRADLVAGRAPSPKERPNFAARFAAICDVQRGVGGRGGPPSWKPRSDLRSIRRPCRTVAIGQFGILVAAIVVILATVSARPGSVRVMPPDPLYYRAPLLVAVRGGTFVVVRAVVVVDCVGTLGSDWSPRNNKNQTSRAMIVATMIT